MSLFDVVNKFGNIELESSYPLYTFIAPNSVENNDNYKLFWYNNGSYIKNNNSTTMIFKNNEGKFQVVLTNPRFPVLINKDWFKKDALEPIMQFTLYEAFFTN